MTKVKICGITNLEDARLSAKFGADALGFNFYEKSPRYISPEKAREIIERISPEILKVGVFVNENLKKIVEIAETAKLGAIQLHGEETPEFAAELKTKTNLEIIKAFRVSPEFKPENVLEYKTDAILLDAYSRHEHGGTGETFDWEIAKKMREIFPKTYLAGGLSQDNIADAIFEVKPFAVDACSCLESEKGKKDNPILINFLCNVLFSRRTLPDSRRNISELENFLYILRLYRSRPTRYLPEKSITQLCTFLVGFVWGKSDDSIYKLLKDFESHAEIRGRSQYVHGIYTYAGHFLKASENQEDRAFDLFFADFEEFLLEIKN